MYFESLNFPRPVLCLIFITALCMCYMMQTNLLMSFITAFNNPVQLYKTFMEGILTYFGTISINIYFLVHTNRNLLYGSAPQPRKGRKSLLSPGSTRAKPGKYCQYHDIERRKVMKLCTDYLRQVDYCTAPRWWFTTSRTTRSSMFVLHKQCMNKNAQVLIWLLAAKQGSWHPPSDLLHYACLLHPSKRWLLKNY